MGKARRTESVINLDVASADASEILQEVQIPRCSTITIQVEYEGLDTADGVLKFQQGGRPNYDDMNGVNATLLDTENTHTINLNGFNPDWIRPVFEKGTNSTGTIKKINYKFS